MTSGWTDSSARDGAAGGPGRTRITSRKWDGSPHRDNHAVDLGADQHGRWLWMPEDEPVITANGSYLASAGLRLFPPGDVWWSAFFVPGRRDVVGIPHQEYVDITTPAVVRPGLIEFVDLDLDVERMDDGNTELLDRDEFDTHRTSMRYPPGVAERALVTAGMIRDRMSARRPPFDGSWHRWHDLAVERGL